MLLLQRLNYKERLLFQPLDTLRPLTTHPKAGSNGGKLPSLVSLVRPRIVIRQRFWKKEDSRALVSRFHALFPTDSISEEKTWDLGRKTLRRCGPSFFPTFTLALNSRDSETTYRLLIVIFLFFYSYNTWDLGWNASDTAKGLFDTQGDLWLVFQMIGSTYRFSFLSI